MGRPRKQPEQLSRPRDARRHAESDAKVLEVDLSATPEKMRPLPGAKARHARTRRWWKSAASSPQATLFVETDWLVMERLADLYDAFFAGALTLGAEIRLCEAKLGFTPEDRLRLRWKLSELRRDEERQGEEEGSSGPAVDPRLKLMKGGAA